MESSTESGLFEKRQPVFWNGFDVFLLFLLWLTMMSVGIGIVLPIFIGQDHSAQQSLQPVQTTTDHPLSQLLEHGKKSPIILLVAFFSGVLSAPLTEEFLFRLVLQGWLTKKLNHWQFSIIIVSVLFALAHAGKRTVQPVDIQFYTMLGIGIINLFLFCFGIFYLATIRGVSFGELGLKANRIFYDWAVAAGTFIVSAPLILSVHFLLRNNFPDKITDPIPLFIFSMILGLLYYRTGRLLPCVVLHALLNGFSFAVILL
ncbi:MAG: CPBP family intramembrane metalloprotease [Planctomycetaceae bacterium]|jgi:membrane protease YdiL (CAAX protease family)|nr:CPBP family intramembrane metalloprotease [Planctomycetaceae bacterium]